MVYCDHLYAACLTACITYNLPDCAWSSRLIILITPAVRRHTGATLLGGEDMAELDLDADVVLHAHARATSSYRSILAPGVQSTPSAHPIECLRVDARDRLCLLVL